MKTDEEYKEAARKRLAKSPDIEVEPKIDLSRLSWETVARAEGGAWVMCWVWIKDT